MEVGEGSGCVVEVEKRGKDAVLSLMLGDGVTYEVYLSSGEAYALAGALAQVSADMVAEGVTQRVEEVLA